MKVKKNLYSFLIIVISSILISKALQKFIPLLTSPHKNSFIFNLNSNSNYKPVIGIYGNSYPENGDTYINGTFYQNSYVLWLQEFGAEVMAIQYWYDFSTIDELLSKVNGVLFMGGGRSIRKNLTWEIKAKYIMEKALETQLPVWGTCQGLQLIGVLMSTNLPLTGGFEDNPFLHGLQLTEEAKGSEMFDLFNEKDLEMLEKKNSTIYFHHYGFTPENWQKDKRINELFKATSISQDKNGAKFINTYEGKNESIKFFATQFHAEKDPYKRYEYKLDQTMDCLRVSQLLGMKFVDVARKNGNRFDSEINNEGDRKRFDFFDTYQGNPNAEFLKDKETYYFSKDKSNK